MKPNVTSLAVSVITAVVSAAIVVQGRGSGMEGLSSVFALIIVAAIGFSVAFILALVAMLRGEQPFIVTLTAFAIPPIAGLCIFLLR